MPLQLINLFLNKSFTNLNLKKLLLLFFLSIFFIFQNYLADAKYASIIMNENTGKIYYQKNASTMNYPASLTKIMTLYMIFDSLKSKKITMKTKFKVSKSAAIKPPSKLGLHPGSTISVRNAILALITKSANDVASVVAENLGKTEKRFAKKMTAMAKKNWNETYGFQKCVRLA